MESAAATRGRGAQEQRFAHDVFLSLWLVCFVLPSAVRLDFGHSVRVCVPPPLHLRQGNGCTLGLDTDAHPAPEGLGAFP
jgi:hypothetical protein